MSKIETNALRSLLTYNLPQQYLLNGAAGDRLGMQHAWGK